jgi:hypothetical protein
MCVYNIYHLLERALRQDVILLLRNRLRKLDLIQLELVDSVVVVEARCSKARAEYAFSTEFRLRVEPTISMGFKSRCSKAAAVCGSRFRRSRAF